MAVKREPKRNVLSVAPHGCPPRPKWPRDGDAAMTPAWLDWRVWLVAIALMLLALFGIVPYLLSRWMP